jgi:transposase
MRVLYERCAGLDVHKDLIVACVRRAEGRQATHEIERFATTTRGLLELRAWLESHGCTHVAMEATGAYWKSVWHVLEDGFELVLANAAHIRNVPGRKSDVSDAAWISDLLAHGLIRASFVPPRPIQELRDLTRTRRQLVREIAQHTQRLQRVLEDANVKLSSVVSNVVGLSGRRIVRAMIDGETDAEQLAELGHPRLRCSKKDLEEALRGSVREHHRFLLRQHLRTIEQLEQTVGEFEERIEALIVPFQAEFTRLTTIPGISTTAAQVLLAEIGSDMTIFPSAKHLLSWAGLCPRLDESAGKHRSTRLRKGAPWLKPVLVQCAWAAARTKGTYLQSQFMRIKARGGPKKAAVAVAASILTAVYHMLRDGQDYQDLGPAHLSRRDSDRVAARLARRIRELGYEVDIRAAAA